MVTLTDAEVMALLDQGRSMLGPLTGQARRRLFAVIDNPTQETWEDAYSVILRADTWMTLWQALLAHTGYDVTSKDYDAPWPVVPTREQIAAALTAALEG